MLATFLHIAHMCICVRLCMWVCVSVCVFLSKVFTQDKLPPIALSWAKIYANMREVKKFINQDLLTRLKLEFFSVTRTSL